MNIIEVNSKKEMNDFIEAAAIINRNNKQWVAPIKSSVQDVFSENNPLWHQYQKILFVAYDDNKNIIGRIGGFFSPVVNNELSASKIGYFGFLEAINNPIVFQSLFDKVEQWLKMLDCHIIKGPFNPTINYELGVLVNGYEEAPAVMMPHNQQYYNALILQCDYKKEMDFFAYHLEVADFTYTDRMKKINDYLSKRFAIKFRNVNFKQFDKEGALIREIYNDGFAGHYGFTPFELDEFYYMAKDLSKIMNKQLIFILEVNEEAVGFLLALPDLNIAIKHLKNGNLLSLRVLKFLWYKIKINRVRVINIAIKKQYQNLGFGALFYKEIIERLKKENYTGGEMSWVVENNIEMINAAKALGGEIKKTYRVYTKTIV